MDGNSGTPTSWDQGKATPPDSGILCGAAGLRGPGTVAQNPVNQRAVQKRQTESRSRPAHLFAPNGNNPAGAAGSRQSQEPRIMGVFQGFHVAC